MPLEFEIFGAMAACGATVAESGLWSDLYHVTILHVGAREADITKLGIVAATILVAAGAVCSAAAWAADGTAATASKPKTCINFWDFVSTNCDLTWQGITVYGIVDMGGAYQTHGAPFDPRSSVGASYLLQKQNRSAIWSLAPNGLSNSTIGIKGTEPIGGNFSFVFALDAGFDPYSFKFSNGPGAAAFNAGTPLNQQTAWSDTCLLYTSPSPRD